MADSSDEELVMEKVSSQETPQEFSVVPKTTQFIFKLKNAAGKSLSLLEYSLTEGKELPYTTMIKGRKIEFSRRMEPSFENMILLPKKDGSSPSVHVFQDIDISELNNSAVSDIFNSSLLSNISEAPESSEFGDENNKESNLTVSTISLSLGKVLESHKDKDRLAPFGCFICQCKFSTLNHAEEHVRKTHGDIEWQSEALKEGQVKFISMDDSDSSINKASGSSFDLDLTGATESGSGSGSIGSGNIHSNRIWFADMEESFLEKIVGRCSQEVKTAVAENASIESIEDRRAIAKEIVDKTLNAVHKIFGSDNPKKKNADKIAGLLASVYPAMFKYETAAAHDKSPSVAGYGLGGVKGLKNLPSIICQRYHDKFLRPKRGSNEVGEGDSENDEETPKKKGKVKVVYGVKQKKWYSSKMSAQSLNALKMAGKIQDYQGREEIFCQNRAGLMQLIRNSSTSVSKVCDGFFHDPRHLEEHFVYLTENRISDKVRNNLLGHIENLEQYLLFVNSAENFMEKYEKVLDDCQLEFEGSSIHKYIHILRWTGEDFDGDGSTLIRVEEDGPPKSASPHIFAAKVGKHYNFELWVEGSRILHNMDLAEAISAFFHLSFTFNLKYPQNADFLCDFLQREVAEYGDTDGTRTNKAKSTAENKLAKFYMKLGKAMATKKIRIEQGQNPENYE